MHPLSEAPSSEAERVILAGGNFKEVFVFTFASNSWEKLPDLPFRLKMNYAVRSMKMTPDL